MNETIDKLFEDTEVSEKFINVLEDRIELNEFIIALKELCKVTFENINLRELEYNKLSVQEIHLYKGSNMFGRIQLFATKDYIHMIQTTFPDLRKNIKLDNLVETTICPIIKDHYLKYYDD